MFTNHSMWRFNWFSAANVFLLLSGMASSALGSVIASYTFNDGTANDQSGNANHATVFGATLTTDRFGNTNSAFYFDGNDDYIDTPVNSNSIPVSFSVWFRSDTTFGERSIVDSDTAGHYGHSLIIDYALGGAATGNLDVQFHDGASDTGAFVNDGRWHHAVASFGANLDVYLNNVLVYSQAYSPPTLDGSNFRLGRHNWFDPQFFHGAIDDVMFFDRALTAGEVNNLYHAIPEPTSFMIFGVIAVACSGVAVRHRR